MNIDNEVVSYLQALIHHYYDCTQENCAECAIVHGLCAHVRNRIFESAAVPAAVPTVVANARVTAG